MIEEHQSYLMPWKQRTANEPSHWLRIEEENGGYSLLLMCIFMQCVKRFYYKYIAESESDNRAWTSKTDAGLFAFTAYERCDQRRKDGFFTLYIIGDSTQNNYAIATYHIKSTKPSLRPLRKRQPCSGADHWKAGFPYLEFTEEIRENSMGRW